MKKFSREKKFNKVSTPRRGNRDSEDSDFRPRSSSGRSFERRDSGRPQRKDSGFNMTEVICDKCKKRCDVPFKPDRSKPVYCRECFSKVESAKHQGRFPQRPGTRFASSGGNAQSGEFSKINRKLDKIMKILGIQEDEEEE